MLDTPNPSTLDTTHPEWRREQFENAWRSWRSGDEAPRWEEFLPAPGEPCDPDLIFLLVRIDIEFRARAGLPGLLNQRYFDHSRLQQEDAHLRAEQKVELLRSEYHQRWKNGQRARRAEYEAAFPQHADALRDLTPRSSCPQCGKTIVLEETAPSRHCPDCGRVESIGDALPTFVIGVRTSAARMDKLDLRDYELIEELGKGGMGEIYRADDPALGRELAIKVIKKSYRDHVEVERRFLREARITGSLQHPGIVAVHNLGRLGDGRLHYTMRLVRGRTFAAILKEEGGKREYLPSLLGIFEKICQAVAYAHSKRVLHRDLKPANIMVGRFGEVQVMDWGLAKALLPDETETASKEQADEMGTVLRMESADTPSDLSRTGSGMGTPAYMPTEQALGEWDKVDERADVFALGSILCQMLTGRPAYCGRDSDEVFRRARCGDLTEAWGLLEECGAEATLMTLCRECLAPQREDRPRDANVVAQRVAAYQIEVQERLRQAELERVAAQTRAQEEQTRAAVEHERTREALGRVAAERRATRRTRILAFTVLFLFVLGGSAGWWFYRQEEQRRRGVEAALENATQLRQQGRRKEARATLEQARWLAERGPKDLLARVQRAEENLKLIDRLESIRLDRALALGERMAEKFALTRADEQYTAAFREFGLGTMDDDIEVVARRIEESGIREELVAALDDWATLPRERQRAVWLRRLAQKADPHPWRDRFRDPALVGNREALEKLAAEADVAELSPQILKALGGALIGTRGDAVPLLSAALGRYPDDFWLNFDLGVVLVRNHPQEALRYFQAALARRPEAGVVYQGLAQAMYFQKRLDEAERLYHKAIDRGVEIAHYDLALVLYEQGHLDQAIEQNRRMISRQPGHAKAHNNLAAMLLEKDLLQEASEEVHKALKLDPNLGNTHCNLGVLLARQGRWEEGFAECRKGIALHPLDARTHRAYGIIAANHEEHDKALVALREAIRLDPTDVVALSTLGAVLRRKGQLDEAIAAFRKVLAVNPKRTETYLTLGGALEAAGRREEAVAAYRKAIDLDRRSAPTHQILAEALLKDQRLDDAIVEFRAALLLAPNSAKLHTDLGVALHNKGLPTDAIAEHEKALKLNPKEPIAHYNLGRALAARGRFDAAIASYQKALEFKNAKPADVHNEWGLALRYKGQVDDAIVEYRRAIACDPKYGLGYLNLGLALLAKKQTEPALEAFRKAVKVSPHLASAHLRLGDVLVAQGELDQAIAAYRKAIDLDPNQIAARNNLVRALLTKGSVDEAVDQAREALKTAPALAPLQRNLGESLALKSESLLNKGRFAEARDAARESLKLLPFLHPLRSRTTQLSQICEHFLLLEQKLPKMLDERVRSADPRDRVLLPQLCYHKRLYATAARRYAEVFEASPQVAQTPLRGLRYRAACSAALAGGGQGEDAVQVDDKERARLRKQALEWLRTDLTLLRKQLDGLNARERAAARQTLVYWQKEDDLRGVRDTMGLVKLSRQESADWLALWTDVAQTLAKDNGK